MQLSILTTFLILEFLCLTTLFGLVGYANPNTYRSALLEDGLASGLEMSASPIPVVWTARATTTTLYLTLSTFLLLVLQAILHILALYPPLLAAAATLVLAGVWLAVIAVFQVGTQGSVPWFLKHSCEHVFHRANYSSCRQAQAVLAVSVLLVAVYAGVVAWAAWVVFAGRRRGRGAKGKEVEGAQMEERVGTAETADSGVGLREV
ncbi:hypothetical protein FN846DRAFT_951928 [Sphaerosporella brunnea]|uniref:MARVEL domain-containing protein n=1 Tax=Sphaerosporella brunnea TaxID=1250544 RepID=A0A5J5EUT2_9PEZI|nr:hypothetical protein FN846DRAFT_951928 [Sphaerosporella brunnea]